MVRGLRQVGQDSLRTVHWCKHRRWKPCRHSGQTTKSFVKSFKQQQQSLLRLLKLSGRLYGNLRVEKNIVCCQGCRMVMATRQQCLHTVELRRASGQLHNNLSCVFVTVYKFPVVPLTI